MRWDENSSISRPERVSPWKIEPASTPPLNPVPAPRNKRARANHVFPLSNSSSFVTTRDGMMRFSNIFHEFSLLNCLTIHWSWIVIAGTKTFVDSHMHEISKVLQGQETKSLHSVFAHDVESEISQRPTSWIGESKNDGNCQSRLGKTSWKSGARNEPMYSNMLTGFNVSGDTQGLSSVLRRTHEDNGPSKNHHQEQDGKFTLLSKPWLMQSNVLDVDRRWESSNQINVLPNQKIDSSRYGGHGYLSLQSYGIDHSTNWSSPKLPPNHIIEGPIKPILRRPQPCILKKSELPKVKGSGNCRIFGFQLNSNPEILDLETTHINAAHVSDSHSHPASIHQGSGFEIDQHTDECKGNNSTDSDLVRKEQVHRLQSSTPTSKDASKPCHGSARSCTKVCI